MGSLEEEKLLQMVHDFIESSDSSTSSSSSSLLSQKNSRQYFNLQEILRKKTVEETEILEKVSNYLKNKMELEKTTRLKQWVVKCLKLDGFNASFCHTSWLTTPSCPCGSYEYVEVVKQDNEAKGGLQRIKVDIDFKSQFEVARPTQSYTKLLSKLPTIFVGSEDKLNRIISVICSAAQDSLRERGLHVPPWRRASYMQSKWNLLLSNNNSTNKTSDDDGNIYPNNKISTNKYNNCPSKLEKWGPQKVTIEGRRKELGGRGSALSNQFSNLSINCC